MTPSWLQRYLDRGFRLVFFPGGLKGPRESGWTERHYTAADYRDGDNVGVMTGVEVAPGAYLADVDLDWPEGAVLAQRLLPNTNLSWGRPSKSLSHLLYTTPEPVVSPTFRDTDGTMLVELRGTKADGTLGLQTMAPPSRHPCGEVLTFREDGDLGHVADLPTWVRNLAIGCLLLRHVAHRGLLHEHRLAVAGTLLRAGLAEADVVAISQAVAALTGNNVADVGATVRSTAEKLAGHHRATGAAALAKALGADGPKVVARLYEWLHQSPFDLDTRGHTLNNRENAVRALDLLGVHVSFDEFAHKHLVTVDGGPPRPYEDAVMIPTRLLVDERFKFLPPRDLFGDVVMKAGWEHNFHPVKDYLATLTWDGVPRLDTWLITCGGADDTPLNRAVGRLVLVAAVRRVHRPGCKFDELLVLESPQGHNKSLALRTLCPGETWFSDDLPLGVDAKQIIERTAGKWIIEAADLSGMHQRDVDHLKSMLSRQADGPVRLAYAHLPEEVPRQFIIIGTTNAHVYLRDATGNRRFWPVRVGRFDLDTVTNQRDQLWAEAAHREAQGESVRLDEALWNDADEVQEARRLVDQWEALLAREFNDDHVAYRVTENSICCMLNLAIEHRTDGDARRIASIMQRLGFRRLKVRPTVNETGGKRAGPEWGWGRDAGQSDLYPDAEGA